MSSYFITSNAHSCALGLAFVISIHQGGTSIILVIVYSGKVHSSYHKVVRASLSALQFSPCGICWMLKYRK